VKLTFKQHSLQADQTTTNIQHRCPDFNSPSGTKEMYTSTPPEQVAVLDYCYCTSAVPAFSLLLDPASQLTKQSGPAGSLPLSWLNGHLMQWQRLLRRIICIICTTAQAFTATVITALADYITRLSRRNMRLQAQAVLLHIVLDPHTNTCCPHNCMPSCALAQAMVFIKCASQHSSTQLHVHLLLMR
jgi:hypothetical protein